MPSVLALYGKAPRYNASLSAIQKDEEGDGKSVLRSNDVRNIMTRGSKQCYCHLIFEANDHRLYKAEWNYRTEAHQLCHSQEPPP